MIPWKKETGYGAGTEDVVIILKEARGKPMIKAVSLILIRNLPFSSSTLWTLHGWRMKRGCIISL
jgi:hypothetical protein